MLEINKKGFSLVEVLASVMILALITSSILLALSFSQRIVQENSTQDAYGAEVQKAADEIMNYVNAGLTTGPEIQNAIPVTGEPVYIHADPGFDSSINQVQFQIHPEPGGSGLYKITVRLYYGPNNKRHHVEMECFAHKDW